jgi:hypothetical protein
VVVFQYSKLSFLEINEIDDEYCGIRQTLEPLVTVFRVEIVHLFLQLVEDVKGLLIDCSTKDPSLTLAFWI